MAALELQSPNISQDEEIYKLIKDNWNEDKPTESLKVLDPEDPLMKRFQEALKTHLVKINKNLTEEINELKVTCKETNKKREEKGLEMYEAQREISRQQTAVEKYRKLLEDIKQSREEKECHLIELKEIRNRVRNETEEENRRAEEMLREIESTSSLYKRFSEYEQEISDRMAVAERMSQKDATVEREMIRQKQEADYILWKLSEEIWRLEKEIDDLRRQIEIKNEEKLVVTQTVADADADLGGLQRERKDLMDAWNSVISSIVQRDKVFDELSHERLTMRESFKTLLTRIEKVKKDTQKEMENNEKLTEIKSRLEEEVRCIDAGYGAQNDQAEAMQYRIDKLNNQIDYYDTQVGALSYEFQGLKNEEKSLDQELDKLAHQKKTLENDVSTKLEDKVIQDKAVRSLTKVLRDTRETANQLELSMIQTENQYGKNLLNLERLTSDVSSRKEDLEELAHSNSVREKELADLQGQVEKYNSLIERKQKQIVELNKKIDEINSKEGGGIDMAPQDIKIASLEKSIEEFDAKNQESQQQWLRQESLLVRLTQEQDVQLDEINRLSKQIMIMEQKNLKLERLLENEKKTEKNIDRRMNELHQRLIKTNAILAEQKELKDQLQDKNFITKDEFTKKLQDEETELIKLENNIRDLAEEKSLLEDKLRAAHSEYLSWEKKVKVAAETSRVIKEEQNPGGEVAVMKSEIHKMEMRLLHLKKAQEKMIKDMEHCVVRREMIMDAALAKEQKNLRGSHNKQVMFEKRMEGRRMKIKQISKENKSLENQILELQAEKNILEIETDENKKLLKDYEDEIYEIDKQIAEAELMKHHKLECLVRKQRKIGLLQKVREGKYKMFHKSEAILNDELERQRILNGDLIEIMEQTSRDFPHLKDDIKKILLTLQLS
ncbi:GSCOCG00000125001-RA-CDS [Cotesia congregata]|uniref:Similar to Ccdc40: Coiled-coil domain-containing protein 40 (Mus musculus) n=1 Tax=Cotesia congregata TaxID=51543 RepID=A0A8J2MQ26_COTCN|nr:GSCOCG00000125001-RA-CDS [Cotesia congregata]CAG5101047.1 Similar to Ccdc40: Coiled-coil domain-containing protein 40 (Mus musculus) [Cotesia congregata]